MSKFVLLLVGTFLLADYKIARAESESDDRIRVLVGYLASKNSSPATGDGRLYTGAEPPASYSTREQAVVFLAIQQLFQEREAGCDVLVEHLKDKRYSYCYDAPSGIYDRSVGAVCFDIVRLNIYCYQDLGVLRHFTGGQNFLHEMGGKELSTWWKEHRKEGLLKIQLRMIDHQIEWFKNLDLEKAPSVHPHAKKPPIETLQELRAINIRTLEAMKAEINVTKRPYRPKSIDQPFGRMTFLPWATASFNK